LNRTIPVLAFLLAICAAAPPASGQDARLPDVTYMDQPTGIELSVYTATWPALEPFVTRAKAGQSRAVEADLRRRATDAHVSDGEMNLLAQLAWQRGELDDADAAAAKALSLQPKQALNWFQVAMTDFAHLRRASWMFEQWKWQRQTWDAYQHTFDLDPHNVSARYYLAYSYMNTPSIGGGDLNKALELSEGGIALGQNGFYAVRADAHRVRGELDAANADYDTAIKLKVIKLGGLLDAGQEELGRQHLDRAKRYFDWAVHCRPDSAKAYEGLGDYYMAVNDRQHARESYMAATQKEPASDSAKTKLVQLSRNP
jgi:tetratricopeptide (TPR) repeat protein